MKVYLINSVCGNGSTGRIAVDLANLINENGDTVRIAYGRMDAPAWVKELEASKENFSTVRFGTDNSVKLHGIISRLTDRQGFYSTKATKALIEDIKAFEPDVIHMHNIHGYYLNIKLLLEFLAAYNKKIIFTLHDCWLFTGHCAYFTAAGCEKWKTSAGGCSNCGQKKTYPASLLLDQSSKNWREKQSLLNNLKDVTYVSPSKWLTRLASQSFLSLNPGAKFQTIYNGIDLGCFSQKPASAGHNEKFIVLGVSTEWGMRKGEADFYRLIDDLDASFEVVMLGLPEAKSFVGKNGAKATIIKRTESIKELAAWYQKANVFVNATREDNFPTVNLEALACGTPVITYNVGGSAEAIELEEGTSGVNSLGAAIEPANYEKLLATIKEAAEGSIKFDSNACRSQALNFNKIERYREYLKIYEH